MFFSPADIYKKRHKCRVTRGATFMSPYEGVFKIEPKKLYHPSLKYRVAKQNDVVQSVGAICLRQKDADQRHASQNHERRGFSSH